MSHAPSVPIEELLQHRAWVRTLARSLVRDASSADDVEQEVWVRALRNPPRDRGAARTWLGRVVRSVVHDRFRSDARRVARENAQPPERPSESPYDVVVRTEAHRDLISEVLALPDPYRRAILMCFFDGLTTGEIASRTGVAPETVRKQVQRARAMLRERIERDREGGLRALLLPIVGAPFALPPVAAGTAGSGLTTSAALGGIAVGTKGKLAVAALVIALLALMGGVGTLVMNDDSPADETADVDDDGSSVGGTRRGAGVAERAPADAGAAPTRRDRDRVQDPNGGDGTGNGSGATERTDAPPLVELGVAGKGQVIGSVTGLDGIALPKASVVAYRGPKVLGRGQADETGVFRLDELPDGEFMVAISAPGHIDYRGKVVAGGEALRVTLETASPIHGVVTDAEGGAPVADVPVYLYREGDKDSPSIAFAMTDAEGRFTLAYGGEGPFDVQVGYRMSSRDPSFAFVPQRVEGVSPDGEPVAIELSRGLSITGRFIDAHSEVVLGDFDVRVTGRTESGDRDQSRSRLLRTDGDGSFAILGLLEGTYDITFSPSAPDEGEEAPRVGGTLVREDVAAGTLNLDVRLGRSATISGRLTDENGGAIEAPSGWLQAIPAGATAGGPGTVWIKFAKDGTFTSPPLDADRSYDVQAGSIPGHRMGKEEGIVPGATEVIVRLARATSIAGTVTGPGGKPVGISVPVLAVAQDVSLEGTEGTVSFAYTKADGTFSIEGLGEYSYRLTAGGGTSVYRPKAAVSGVKYGTRDVALEVLPGEVLSGRLLDAAGQPVKAPYLAATSPSATHFESRTRVESDDGSFKISSLPPGKFRIAVVIGNERFDLGEVTVPASNVELRLPE